MRTKTSLVTGSLIVIVAVAAIAFFMPENSKVMINEKKMEEIRGYDLDENYPASPENVMKINENIMTYLYSGNIEETDVEEVVLIQRKLFDDEFLNINPLEAHVASVKSEILDYDSKNLEIVSITQENPLYNPNDNTVCQVDVEEFSNVDSSTKVSYYLRQDEENKWRIFGYMPIEDTVDGETT